MTISSSHRQQTGLGGQQRVAATEQEGDAECLSRSQEDGAQTAQLVRHGFAGRG